ncbi:MAG: ATP-binding protein [Rhodospirillales bacterium]
MRFGLRSKVLLVALVLLAIPWVGFTYVKEMERLLRQGQEQAVVATAGAVAAAMHDRPRLLDLRVQAAGADSPTSADTAGAQRIATGSRASNEDIQLIIKGLGRSESRIWVVDRKFNLLAIAGSLKHDPADVVADESGGGWLANLTRLLRPFTARILQRPRDDFDDALPAAAISGGREVASALGGVPDFRWRNTPDGRAVILSAAHPIWNGEEVMGAVVVEETGNAILTLSNRALEQLVTVTLVAFAIGALTLLAFASRLSMRLRRLRDEAEQAIDSQGRVGKLIAGSRAGDEIGDLSRSFSTMLERLAQYNTYLENMAARLSHELRTPMAVVRSSLDNLGLQPLPGDARVYMERANDGLKRLDTIITRMAEATRLEHMLQQTRREPFDARSVLTGCVSGYASVYPARRFELRLPDEPVPLSGSPDLFVQMLDKLAANAVDFATGGDPVRITLERHGPEASLVVSNTGPPLPAGMQGRLFESMVSMRSESGNDPHLGLGLFIVRLIAEYHGGHAGAANREDGSGGPDQTAVSAGGRGNRALSGARSCAQSIPRARRLANMYHSCAHLGRPA